MNVAPAADACASRGGLPDMKQERGLKMLDIQTGQLTDVTRRTATTDLRARLVRVPAKRLVQGTGLTFVALALAACGGSDEPSANDTRLTLTFEDGTYSASDVAGFSLTDPTRASLAVADAPDDVYTIQLTGRGTGVLEFAFADAQDVVILEAGSTISGFTTLRVIEGTLDATLATISDVVRVEVASGIKLTLAQVREIPVLVSNSETGRIEITVSTVAEAQELTALISAGTVQLFGAADSITVVPVAGSTVTVEEIAEQIVTVREAVRPAEEAPPPPAEVTPPTPAPAPPEIIDTPPPPTLTATLTDGTITFGGTASGDISASLSGATLTFQRQGVQTTLQVDVAETVTITKPTTGGALNLISAPNTVLIAKDTGPTIVLNKATDIQAAIDAVGAGETVLVGSGVFTGNVTLNKADVTLKSLGGSEIKGIVRLEANDIVIDGFKLDGTGQTGNFRGLQIAGGDGITVRNMEISNFITGASLDFASDLGIPKNVTFTGNTFSNNTAGIGSTEGVKGLTISNNTFNNNDEGIGLGGGVGLKDNKSVANLGKENTFTFDLASNQYAIGDYRVVATKFYNDEGAIIVFAGESIQAAIDAATSGDTIVVGGATLNLTGVNRLIVKEGVTLTGAGLGIDGKPLTTLKGGLLELRNGAKVEGLAFVDYDSRVGGSDAVVQVSGSGATVKDSTFTVDRASTKGYAFEISVTGEDATITGNTITRFVGDDSTDFATSIGNSSIRASGVGEITITGNTLDLAIIGVVTAATDVNLTITGNTIKPTVVSKDGIFVTGPGFGLIPNGSKVNIANNTFEPNSAGALLGLQLRGTATDPFDFTKFATAGNDFFQGGAGADIIPGGAGNDTIQGGSGNDTIDISGGGSNTLIFEGSGAANGLDTITGFNGGAIDDGGDVLSFQLFAVDGNATADAASDTDLVNVAGGTTAVASGKITIVNFGGAIAEKAFGGEQFADLFGSDTLLATTGMVANTKAIVVVQGSDQTEVYFVTGTGTAIDAADVTQVATLVGVTSADTLEAANFIL
jgi:hypothetical protein